MDWKVDYRQLDKQGHSWAGAALFAAVFWALHVAGMALALALPAALLAVVLVALSKERYDALHPDVHTSDPKDALATAYGAIAMCIWVGCSLGVKALVT